LKKKGRFLGAIEVRQIHSAAYASQTLPKSECPVAGSTQASGFEVRAKCRWADKSRERMKKTADNCNAPLQLSRNFCSITATGRCDYYIIFA
jgi:hypothetical protein